MSDLKPVNIRVNGGEILSVQCPNCKLSLNLGNPKWKGNAQEIYELICTCSQVINVQIINRKQNG